MPKKPKIAIFTTPQGHLSMAEAITQKIKQLAGDKFEVVQFFSNGILMKEYAMVYKFAPFIFSAPYNLGKIEKLAAASESLLYRKFGDQIQEFVQKHKPVVCINTNFVYNSSLNVVCKQENTAFINVLANPGNVHPLEVSAVADYNLVLDSKSLTTLKKQYPDCSFATTGWFVREQFEKPYSLARFRKKYAVANGFFHILIVSGSEGTSAVVKILPSLLKINEQVVITVACGKSRLLKEQVQLIAKFVQKIAPNIEIRTLLFTKKIHEHMRSADLVIGKAGPNTLFETVATQTPFFAITHVAGQEDINLEIIKRDGLGWVEESPLAASRLLAQIIAHQNMLEKYTKKIKRLAEHNQKSGKRLLTLIEKLVRSADRQ